MAEESGAAVLPVELAPVVGPGWEVDTVFDVGFPLILGFFLGFGFGFAAPGPQFRLGLVRRVAETT